MPSEMRNLTNRAGVNVISARQQPYSNTPVRKYIFHLKTRRRKEDSMSVRGRNQEGHICMTVNVAYNKSFCYAKDQEDWLKESLSGPS